MSSLPFLQRSPVPVGFKAGLAVGIALVSAIRGCAFDVAQVARSLDDAPPVQTATTSATSAVDELPAPTAVAIPTADVEALPHAAVRVEDLPRSHTH